MAHDARSVANALIRRAWDDEQQVTPMKVLKLTYYCHAWMLGLYGEPLIRQPVEAWMYGPVIGVVYFGLRGYGGSAVERPIMRLRREYIADYDSDEEDLIDQVWDKYGHLSGPQLSAMTHAPGTPWYQVWYIEGGEFEKDPIIPNSLIRRYYERAARDYDADH